MLRYHTASANARQWSTDYGLSENAEEFKALYAYSPVHNVKAGTCYPPTLITTADHDDRVVPWHSYQVRRGICRARRRCAEPVLIRVETRAGPRRRQAGVDADRGLRGPVGVRGETPWEWPRARHSAVRRLSLGRSSSLLASLSGATRRDSALLGQPCSQIDQLAAFAAEGPKGRALRPLDLAAASGAFDETADSQVPTAQLQQLK